MFFFFFFFFFLTKLNAEDLVINWSAVLIRLGSHLNASDFFLSFFGTELEVEESIINWSAELMQLGSRLYAMWNRTAGDCLLDSILQVTWGVFDTDNTLRRSLADSLTEGAMV